MDKSQVFVAHSPRFLEATAADNEPVDIFKKQQILKGTKTNYDKIIHMTICKDLLVCVVNNSYQVPLLSFALPSEKLINEIHLERDMAGYKISKIFLDTTGQHMIISRVPKETGLLADFLYKPTNGAKVRRVERFRDHEITAVAFNPHSSSQSTTGAILLGTRHGLIFETELLAQGDKPLYGRQVYDLGLGRQKYSITALEILRIPKSSKYVVIAASRSCVYTFQETLKPEEKSLQAIFATYVNGTQLCDTREALVDPLGHSVLRLYTAPGAKYPSHWGWLTGTDLHTGKVSADILSDLLLTGDKVISVKSECPPHQTIPLNFLLTEHHALFLYSDRIKAVCLLNEQVVYEEYFPDQQGKLRNLLQDSASGAVYLYTDKAIFNLRIINESSNIWKIYLEKGLYDDAELNTRNIPDNLYIVSCKKAEAAFAAGQYMSAANIYATTHKAFEEVCLKFITLENKEPLIHYVRSRFKKLTPENAVQVSMLVVWLTDLYLTQIHRPDNSPEVRANWQLEFDTFLADQCIAKLARENRSLIQSLIAQHDDAHNLSQFAVANGDYAEVIKQKLSDKKYEDVLTILRKQRDSELFYRYCPTLVEHLPQQTVAMLKQERSLLQIDKLVPGLLKLDSAGHAGQIIDYLEHCVYKCGLTNKAAHNFLLRLYAEHQPDKLLGYLNNEGNKDSVVSYDMLYALSVFTDFGLREACVFVQCLLKMWSTAVDLALSFKIDLAKHTASKPEDKRLRRKLWLRIAYHEVKGTNDVQKALNLLQECDLLRIEDLLPFFSDFEKIDDFKDPICQALKNYNNTIQELQHEMEECTKQAERIQEDLQNVHEHRVRIETHATCAICEQLLLVRPFFIFNCGHKFHSDCLELVVPALTSDNSRKLTSLKQQSLTLCDNTSQHQKKCDTLKLEIEQLLAANCYCCCLMVESIEPSFNWDRVNVDWE